MKKNYLFVAITITIAVFCISAFYFVRDASRFRGNAVFARPTLGRGFFMLQSRQPTPPSVESLEEWMTLNYINKLFNLPPDYLKLALAVSDVSYPNITISKLSAEKNESADAYVATVKEAVKSYLNQNSTSQ